MIRRSMLTSTNVSDPYFILHLSNLREVNVSEAACPQLPLYIIGDLNVGLHVNLLNLLLLLVRDDAQVEPTVNTQTTEPRATAALLSMGILQIKFMRHTELQEANKIKTTFFIYNGNNGNNGIMGIIRVQFVVYNEIIYSASLFNRLNGLGFASSFNLLN